jgi:N-acetylmuramoyl-L-alanine amidase
MPRVIRDLPSPNHDARPEGAPVDHLILHYTGMRSGAEAIARLRDPAAGVSSHYVVEEDGSAFRLVPEERRAWHAGVSHWRGVSGLNARSIGIEIVNPGHEHGYRDFPLLQMAGLSALCRDIVARWPIPARNVVAHSDVSPDRKEDPGERFDWRALASDGVGLWADVPGEDRAAVQPATLIEALARIGYRSDLPAGLVIQAFQRHWRPERVDGRADAGTLARAQAVLALVAP